MDIKKIVGTYFVDNFHIPTDKDYEIEWVDARTLIKPSRLDLIVKYKYVDAYELGYDTEFFYNMYKAHIDAFSNGTFMEPGNPEKNSLRKYIDTFHKLIASIKSSELDSDVSVIPVGADDTIIDGAHRVSASAYFHRRVPIVRFPWVNIDYGADYFLNRFLPRGYVDYCISEYINMIKGEKIHIAIIWPRADEDKIGLAEKILEKNTKLIYRQEFSCSYNMIRNLVILCYRDTASQGEWLGNFFNGFCGADGKAYGCFADKRNVHIYYFQKDSLSDVLSIKEQIRQIFGISNHSCHITDTPEEAMRIANMLCNSNSVDLLKYGKPSRSGDFALRLSKFKTLSDNCGIANTEYIVDSSSIMGLYGMRSVGDIDYITASNKKGIKIGNADAHFEYLPCYGTSADDFVLNPQNYLWFMGMKFASLEMVKKLKMNRNEGDAGKDAMDVMMIEAVQNRRYDEFYNTCMDIIVNIYQTKSIDLKKFVNLLEIEFSQKGFRNNVGNEKEPSILVVALGKEVMENELVSNLRNLRRENPLGNIVLVTEKRELSLPYINKVYHLENIEKSKDIIFRLCKMVALCRAHLWKEKFSLCLMPFWQADADISSFLAFLSGAGKRIGYIEKREDNGVITSPYRYLITRAQYIG